MPLAKNQDLHNFLWQLTAGQLTAGQLLSAVKLKKKLKYSKNQLWLIQLSWNFTLYFISSLGPWCNFNLTSFLLGVELKSLDFNTTSCLRSWLLNKIRLCSPFPARELVSVSLDWEHRDFLLQFLTTEYKLFQGQSTDSDLVLSQFALLWTVDL